MCGSPWSPGRQSMSRQIWNTVPLLLVVAVSATAADEGERQNLTGSWVSENEPRSGWTIGNKNDVFQIVETSGDSTVAEYVCKADGHDCQVKIAGKKATVSMWFNGSKLVQLETQGTNVVKRRFAALPQGEAIEVETIPIVPDGRPETLRFKRMKVSAQK
jgi:hypothetical protein